jgi:hypothetical protein
MVYLWLQTIPTIPMITTMATLAIVEPSGSFMKAFNFFNSRLNCSTFALVV